MTVPSFVLQRPPQTDDELHAVVMTLWNVNIPRTRVCPNHVAPFEAFADAFFARSPVSVWKAARGFGGKSHLLAMLSMTEAVVLGAKISLLGGSFEQSKNVHSIMRDSWDAPLAPRQMLVHHGEQEMKLTNGSVVRPLTASQRTVRGPHPSRLRLDEVDEMDVGILDAALGQPMPDEIRGIETQTTISSTHQYADKTMAEMLRRAGEKGWPTFLWCWRESSNPVDGWLSPFTIERKRQEVSKQMWEVEYDLQEPGVGNRAFDVQSVEKMFQFSSELPVFHAQRNNVEEWEFEAPTDEGEYTTAADWAQTTDYTVIVTFRIDCKPWRCVAYYKGHRRPYPQMVNVFNKRLERFGGMAIHDGTGLGAVVSDYLDAKVQNFIMSGRQRADMLSEYVAAVERGEFIVPKIESAYTAHKYASVEDLYKTGQEYHLPDEVCAFALAWLKGRKSQRKRIAAPVGVFRLDEAGQETQTSAWRI